MTITDDNGRQVRRFDVAKGAGLRRVAWNLRADAPARGARGLQPSGAEPPIGRGRGGPPQGPLVTPGRYHAQLGTQVGGTVTPLGNAQSFMVVTLDR
jgi:hypothetical protein